MPCNLLGIFFVGSKVLYGLVIAAVNILLRRYISPLSIVLKVYLLYLPTVVDVCNHHVFCGGTNTTFIAIASD